MTRIFAADVLVSGNAFFSGNENLSQNLNQLDHSFTFVNTAEYSQFELSPFDILWLDGFSDYGDVRSDELINYLENGGIALIQNPGFGSQGMANYPFGNELSASINLDGEQAIRIFDHVHAINAGLNDGALSDWAPASAVGTFTNLGTFSGLTDNGVAGNWITIVREVGQGLLVYTQHVIGQSIAEQSLASSSGQLTLLNNILSWRQEFELQAPEFVLEHHFWRDEQGDLLGLLQHPNSDGLDTSGTQALSYQFNLEDDSGLRFGPIELSSEFWPLELRIPVASVPDDAYYIGLARQIPGLASQKVLRLGPTTTARDPGILFAYSRWLLHLPRTVGGFSGVLKLANLNVGQTVDVVLTGFDNTGGWLATETFRLNPAEVRYLDLYGAVDTGVFSDPALLDRVSHVAVWDHTNQSKASLQYTSDLSAFGVWVDEVHLDQGLRNGQRFVMDSGIPDQEYYDGVAILNTKHTDNVEVVVQRFRRDGSAEGEVNLGTLGPGAKLLSVLNFAFEGFIAEPVYVIEARGPKGNETIQILGLTGRIDGSFFAESKLTKLN